MRDSRPGFLVVVATLLVLCSASCGDRERPGGTLVVALRGDVDSWNPYTSQDATSSQVVDLVYPRLVLEAGFDGKQSRFEPYLASQWSFSDGGKTLTFRLRPDARWSDGTAVSCDDVRFTWEAQTAAELAWPGASLKRRIPDVVCADPHTAVFRFSEAYADALVDANDNAIVPRAYGQVPFAEWRTHPWERDMRSCGPFRLGSVTPGQQTVLERDPLWWGADQVSLDKIVFRPFAEGSVSLQRFLAGEVDVLVKVPPLRAAEVGGHPGMTLHDLPSLTFTYLGWNVLARDAYRVDRKARGCGAATDCPETVEDILRLRRSRPHPVLSDARVRRALSLAIDREDLVDGLWGGYARPGTSAVVSSLWAHDPAGETRFDALEAARLLDEAGFSDPDGDGVREREGVRLELRVIVNSENQTRRDAAERAAASLARVGVKLVPQPLARGEFGERARNKEFDAVIAGWSAGTRVEPHLLLSTRSAVGRGYNFTSWSTPASDALFERALAATTREDALPLWRDWQLIFRDESPIAVLYEERTLVGIGARVSAAVPYAINPYQNLYLARVSSAPPAPR